MRGIVKGYSRRWRIGMIETSDGTPDVLFGGEAVVGGDGWLVAGVPVDYELDEEEPGSLIAEKVMRI